MSRRLVVEADGGSRGNPGPAGYGAVVRDADTGEVLREVADGIGVATNNVAEYRGLLAGLAAAAELDPSAVEVRMDSKLVVEQMSGRWKVKHPDMQVLAREAATLVRRLPAVRFNHVPRERNRYADRLANEAMDAAAAGRTWRPSVPQPEPEPARGSVAAASGERPAPNRLSGWSAEPGPPTVTWLLRHGQTTLNVDRRFSGTGPADLTPLGLAQARAAGRYLAGAGIGAIVASPLPRAVDTAAAVGEAVGLPVEVDEDLRETDFGDWEGSTFSEVSRRWPEELQRWLDDLEHPPPNGESFAASAVRVRRARDRALARYGGTTVLVVAHVTPIKLLVQMALDASPLTLYRTHLDSAALSRVDWAADGRAVLRLFNDTCHLRGLE